MDDTAVSPEITRVSWGALEAEGGRRFGDALLYPGGAREWDWRETGTSHSAGIQPADIRLLLDRGAETVVLSTGMNGRLKVSPEAVGLLEDSGIPFEILRTKEAVRAYNGLREAARPGGLFHTTC
jgi:hypothetical protein